MMKYLAIYLFLGAILSTFMYITSRRPLPLLREIAAHVTIVLVWPIVLFNIGRIFSRHQNDLEKAENRDDDDSNE